MQDRLKESYIFSTQLRKHFNTRKFLHVLSFFLSLFLKVNRDEENKLTQKGLSNTQTFKLKSGLLEHGLWHWNLSNANSCSLNNASWSKRSFPNIIFELLCTVIVLCMKISQVKLAVHLIWAGKMKRGV